VCKSFDGRAVVAGLSTRIMRGDRIGIVGPNGAGKSTLLKLILGELAPDAGSVRLGTNLQVAYFDQLREQLDPERSVAETVCPGSDWVEIGPTRKHVVSYLGDFLFPPQRADSPVKMLSGGERNRLLLARLFARPANVLVLDEPTNDLDIDSLELLESTLQDYPGTVLLVSHDRAFLDNVVTQTLAAEGDGTWKEYVGGYSDWLVQRPAARSGSAAPVADARKLGQRAPAAGPDADGSGNSGSGTARGGESARPAKLSYRESRELAQLPGRIEALEAEQLEITEMMSSADYHLQGAARLRADVARLEAIEAELKVAYECWAALDARVAR
jgi:ATP-binding cassette subfamily F protein uup